MFEKKQPQTKPRNKILRAHVKSWWIQEKGGMI
jgi:hypothetical protein